MNELLHLPGLESHLLSGLGPLAFHRFRAASTTAKACAPPAEWWQRRWAVPEDPAEAEAAAKQLLGTAEVPRAGAASLSVGSRVRVKASVQTPSMGWGRISPGACGVLEQLRDDGTCQVAFEAQTNWRGLLHELEEAESLRMKREAFLDELWLLTAAGRPAKRVNMPVHNLLDLAVHNVLRPAIPLLRQRGYELEMLDAYSLESFVQKDQVEAVAAYLEAGISPDIRANAGRPVLMVAAAVAAEQVTQLLLAHGASIDERSGFGGWTALMWAAHAGFHRGCHLLLEAGAEVSPRNDQGLSALDIARTRGHHEIAQALEAAIEEEGGGGAELRQS